jgi:hypothetical protein
MVKQWHITINAIVINAIVGLYSRKSNAAK